MSPAFGEPDDPMHRIVEPNALAHGVGEDRAEQCHGAPGDTTTAAYDRETAWLGLLPASRANDETAVRTPKAKVARACRFYDIAHLR